jgi:hypothetical protein
MPDVEQKSYGAVQHADLTTDENQVQQNDWCMTLEVAGENQSARMSIRASP